MERYIRHMIESAEKRVDRFLRDQVNAPGERADGGMKGDVVDVKPTVYVLTTAIALYVNPDSRYYKSEALMDAIQRGIDFVGRNQRANGSFDFTTCNFFSAPDTAFCFKRLYDAWQLMELYGDRADFTLLQKKYRAILRGASEAIRDGGFHTPNHRWAICAALMQSASLFRDEKEYAKSLLDRAAQYLNEGIDGNRDGEYAERSTGNYNAVVNNAMIGMYECTKDSAYLGYVERNLHMMQAYIEQDDTIFTQNSTRQDKGKNPYPDQYFYQYLYMAVHYGGEGETGVEFDAAAHKIIKDNQARGDMAPDCLHILMKYPRMMSYHFKGYGFRKTCRKYFEESGVLRVKKEAYSYTVMRDKTAFLYFRVKGTEVFFKIGESYCDTRNFIPRKLEVKEDGCVMSATADGWYYLPWKEKPETSDWWKMDQSKREKLISSRIHIVVTVKELEDGIELGIKTDGLDRFPLRLEVCIPAKTVVSNEHFYLQAPAGESMILRSGKVELASGSEILEFGDGFGEHSFKGHYSGEEINASGYTIYCNAYTPVERSVTLRVKK